MKVLLCTVSFLTLLWSGYWLWGSSQTERYLREMMKSTEGRNTRVKAEDISVSGFPNRFDTTITDLHLGYKKAFFEWNLPFIQALSLSYWPLHVILAFPNEQYFRGAIGDFKLNTKKLQASVILAPDFSTALKRVTLVGDEITLARGKSTKTPVIIAESINAGLHHSEPETNNYRLGVEATGFTLNFNESTKEQLSHADKPAQKSNRLYLDAILGLNAPLDRQTAYNDLHIKDINVQNSVLEWKNVTLASKGKLQLIRLGKVTTLEGQLKLEVRNWQQFPAFLEEIGVISPYDVSTITNLLQLISLQTSGDKNTITLPLSFISGVTRLGPLVIGPAPSFRH